ncbi:MAG: hypothetical protein UFA98_10470 [Ruminococcus sp.]|nr:hypothetical protein [Ruminococcus sp.]
MIVLIFGKYANIIATAFSIITVSGVSVLYELYLNELPSIIISGFIFLC